MVIGIASQMFILNRLKNLKNLKNMYKKLGLHLIITLLTTLFCYLVLGFIYWNWNPQEWGNPIRFVFSLLTTYFCFVINRFFYYNKFQ